MAWKVGRRACLENDVEGVVLPLGAIQDHEGSIVE